MAPKKAAAGRSSGAGDSDRSRRFDGAKVKARDGECKPKLTDIDREVIEALTDFRDALRDRTPLEGKYTVRQVGVVVPPPQLGPEDARKTRAALGVSQPVFAGFPGTSLSTVRSWEQGQKPPSPMARRLLGLIASDPSYWKGRFFSMVEPRGGEHEITVVAGFPPARRARDRAESPRVAGVAPSGRGSSRRRSGPR